MTDKHEGETASQPVPKTLAGRITAVRQMAKTTFIVVNGEQAMYPTGGFDLGLNDIVKLTGEAAVTKTGHPTLRIRSLEHHRKGSPAAVIPKVGRLHERNLITQTVRQFFLDRGYIEVPVPVLLNYSQGCHARPFETQDWHNDRLQLKVAHEIGLKMLLVSGYDRIFTIGPCFRNEGQDSTHHPEFTMLEAYQNWADKNDMLKMTMELFSKFSSLSKLDMKVQEGFAAANFPLAESNNGIAEVWDLEIDGLEVATGATEKTAGYTGAPELQSLIDQHGMQPCAGIGIGLDRLVMKVLDLSNIVHTLT